ncbi:MAG: NUDIX domain-containing protein [Granulosicoccus sp.]
MTVNKQKPQFPPARTHSDRVSVTKREQLSNQWARLEQVTFDYKRSDGNWQEQKREIYHRGHGAAVLLYNLGLETIVLTRQFRLPAWEIGGDGFLLEVPAGIIESENPEETIRQETEEETGFIIGQPQFLFCAFATPGSVTEQLYYFSAPYEPGHRSGSGGGLVEEGEDIEVLEVNLDQAAAWIVEGKIIDAKTIILIQYAQLSVFAERTGLHNSDT